MEYNIVLQDLKDHFKNDILDVCKKHNLYLIGSCDSEGILGEISFTTDSNCKDILNYNDDGPLEWFDIVYENQMEKNK